MKIYADTGEPPPKFPTLYTLMMYLFWIISAVLYYVDFKSFFFTKPLHIRQ